MVQNNIKCTYNVDYLATSPTCLEAVTTHYFVCKWRV